MSSDPQFVIVAGDHVTMLVDDVACAASASQLTEECKRQPESFVSAFDEPDCLDDKAVDREYTEGDRCQESLCMMGNVAESYEDKSMVTVDRVSVVCRGQTEYCTAEQLSSTHEQVLDQHG